CPATLSLELDGVDLAAVNGDHVRHAGADTEPLLGVPLRWGGDSRRLPDGRRRHRAHRARWMVSSSFIGRIGGVRYAAPNRPRAPGSVGVEKRYDRSSPKVRRGY